MQELEMILNREVDISGVFITDFIDELVSSSLEKELSIFNIIYKKIPLNFKTCQLEIYGSPISLNISKNLYKKLKDK